MAKVTPNFLDKVVTVFSPERGLRRQHARTHLAMSGSYVGARFDSKSWRGRPASSGDANADTLMDLPRLRNRSRDEMRNSAIAGGAVTNLVRNVVGTGLSAHPSPDYDALGWDEDKAAEWAEVAFREFDLWASSQDCDITRTENFYQGQGLCFGSMLESGDVLMLLPSVAVSGSVYKTRYQIIEADRLVSPNGDGATVKYYASADDEKNGKSTTSRPIWGGVECDEYGAPVAYYILDEHPGALGFLANRNKWKRYAAFGAKTGRRLVLHPFRRLRPDQKRGVPFLAPVIELLRQLSQYTDAEVQAAVISSMFTVFVKTPAAEGLAGLNQAPQSGSGKQESGLAPGAIIDLASGEDVAFANPNRPSTAFDPFVQAVLRQIGMRLGIPFEVLIQHFTASYSAARAALLEFWKLVKDYRNFLATTLCQPVYETWMDEAVALGRISAPGYFSDPVMRKAYQRCEWVGDAAGQINPKDEVAASQAKVDGGFSSIERETMKLEGLSWLDIHRQRKREKAMRVEAGLELPLTAPVQGAVAKPPQGQPEQPTTPDGSDIEKPEAA